MQKLFLPEAVEAAVTVMAVEVVALVPS